jgi:hypothetical protein
MEGIKHFQREETRYSNNEFDNMPSLDYRVIKKDSLSKKNLDMVDWNQVGEICRKHGLDYCILNGYRSIFLLYLKTDIDVDYYNECRKELIWECRDMFLSMVHKYDDTFKAMHKCMHELDENTDLYFDCCWRGNCGLFGSDDVNSKAYEACDSLRSWKFILDRYPSELYDTLNKLQRGIYVLAETYYLKPQKEDSPEFEELKGEVLEITKGLLKEGYTASVEQGKRQCDAKEYEAIVIRCKGEYVGMFKLNRDWLGKYNVTTAVPLAGQSTETFDWRNPSKEVKDILQYIDKEMLKTC